MGGGRWTADDWSTYNTSHVASKATVKDVFVSTTIKTDLNPKSVKIRESRDSKDNPNSTPVILALDVTGSMNMLSNQMARVGLPTLMGEIYDRKPVSNPQIMFMGIGDVNTDRAPLQVSQFESDIRIAKQLTDLWLENGGGGNNSESYTLPWYFAAMHTSIDSWEKRQKKGYLFTFGDECCPDVLTDEDIYSVMGYKPETKSYTARQLFEMVSKKYEVYHLMVMEGDFCRDHANAVKKSWVNVIGERAIPLSDHTKLGEVITSLIEFNEGKSKDEIISSWDGGTSLVVKDAINSLKVKETDGIVVI